MFQQYISKLDQVQRFDRVVSTKDIAFGQVDSDTSQPRLALRLPSSEVVTLEERAQAQLGGQWGIPAAHLERLPVDLAVQELNHFSRSAPRDITIRAVKESGREHLVARAVLSGQYAPFDSRDVLEAIAPYLHGFEVSSAIVNRDEMRVLITMPGRDYDVSSRRVGDIVKSGLSISNSEVGSLSLRAEMSLLRLVCSNGMTTSDLKATRVRHIHIDRHEFIARLRDTVANAGQVGEQIARRLESTHQLSLPDLNPDNGKLQRAVLGVLRRENLATQAFVEEAEGALREGERSLFEMVQFVSDAERLASLRLADRVHRERVAGRLMALAA